MADSEKVLEQLDPTDDVEIIGIVVNEKGAVRSIATEAVTTLGYPYSISETFLRKNQNQSPDENYEVLKAIKQRADNAKLDMVVYISMAFGNPYDDPWSENEVVQAVERIAGLGIRSISLADTVGVATPHLTGSVVRATTDDQGKYEIGVHMHSRRENAAAKILAAYDAGCRRFDSAIGGLGGCPFAQDEMIGNIPTEIAVQALTAHGADVPLKKPLDAVEQMSADIAAKHTVVM